MSAEYVRGGVWEEQVGVLFVVGLLLLLALWKARRGEPVIAIFWWGVLALTAAFIVPKPWLVEPFIAPAFLVAWGYDSWVRRDIPVKERRDQLLVVAAVVAIILVSNYWLKAKIFERYVVRDSTLRRERSAGSVTLDRSQLRIVEFEKEGGREWHVKDGKNNIVLSEVESYRDCEGDSLMGEGLVHRIERWAGVRREKPASVSRL